MIWLALPSPSGNPTTRLVPTSRMISSAIASGSVNSFGMNIPSGAPRTGIAGCPKNREESPGAALGYYTSVLVFYGEEGELIDVRSEDRHELLITTDGDF